MACTASPANRRGFEAPALHECEVKALQRGRQVGRESCQCYIIDASFARAYSSWQQRERWHSPQSCRSFGHVLRNTKLSWKGIILKLLCHQAANVERELC